MKKILSTAIATTLAATGLMATTAAFTTASADMAYNVGVMSQYIFRGAVQRDSASLMAGADYSHDSGLYAGVWTAQVGTENNPTALFGGPSSSAMGLEVDLYGGIKKEFSGVNLGAGFTSYQYTNKTSSTKAGFDTAYNELNFSAAYGPFTATINPGYHEMVGASDEKFLFTSLKGEYEGFYGILGHWDWDKSTDGDYQQAGYKTALGGLDLDAFVVNSSKALNTVGADAFKNGSTTFAMSATKAF
jgi:uncharacterized protein (TIGR02001 family)